MSAGTTRRELLSYGTVFPLVDVYNQPFDAVGARSALNMATEKRSNRNWRSA
jgi:hypothetical protein